MNTPPADYVKISSATGSAEAKCILILPLVLNKRLMGVIELASFRQFNENDQLVLTEICFALAMSLEMLSHKNG
jgi:putative methionine-R-sulfoxide reductase with GAF domain